jgi:drug/metabolite transporter (DMT)-like permease
MFAALTGIALFNTFVYVGARYTTSINLALIGTTSSPIIAVILARIFLKERLGVLKVLGILLCITGILYLLCKGDLTDLAALHFGRGDLWVLAAGLSFAIYNTLVRKKPVGISPVAFLIILFATGTLMLFPFYLHERSTAADIQWDAGLIVTIIYLSAGASVICFLIWNMAIIRLGAGRTALFGNLIPVFSIMEASLFLGEKLTAVHGITILLVFTGIILANIRGNQSAPVLKP